MAKRKQGRPSDFEDNTKKVKANITFDEEVLDKVRMALLTSHKGRHKTISGLVNEAVIQYLDKEKDQND